MAHKKQVVDVNELRNALYEADAITMKGVAIINQFPTVEDVELPCRIGDTVWAIRSFHGIKSPQKGIVGDMFFTRDMELVIVVKYVARGKWGETVFATCEDAANAIARMRKDR